MPRKEQHDASPPPGWPAEIVYLTKPRLSPTFPAPLIPLLLTPYPIQPPTAATTIATANARFRPRPSEHPPTLLIKRVLDTSHPAFGQNGLFAKTLIPGGTLVIPYLGIIHCTFTPSDDSVLPLDHIVPSAVVMDQHEGSDYDLSLLRLSASDPSNPVQGYHVSIGVDAARAGNAARFVNDYRGIAGAPNAEFKVGRGEGGEMRMEVWSMKGGIGKGEEVLVSYGKGWWGARGGG